jgi:hypothetical protein
MVLSTTMRQNLLAVARLGFGLVDKEGLGAPKLTDFIDVTVVVSVWPVPLVLRRSYIELKVKSTHLNMFLSFKKHLMEF